MKEKRNIAARHIAVRAAALALALCTALTAVGCSEESNYPPEMTYSRSMPPESSQLGDYVDTFTATLYFLSEDGRTLSGEEREMVCVGNMSREEAVVRELGKGPQSMLLQSVIPGGLELLDVEISSSVCNVYYRHDNYETDESWLTARVAIAATLNAMNPDIGYVNLFLNGVEPGYAGHALGAQAPIEESVDYYILNALQEYEVLPLQAGMESSRLERNATIYKIDAATKFLVAANAELLYRVDVTTDRIAGMVMNAVMKENAGQTPYYPEEFSLAEAVKVVTLADEAVNQVVEPLTYQVIDVTANEPAGQYDEELLCAVITLSLMSFVPDVRGVRIGFVNGDGEKRMHADGAILTHEAFRQYIGTSVRLVYPDRSGISLLHTDRTIWSSDYTSIEARIEALLSGDPGDGVFHPVFSYSDVKRVYRIDDLVVVDWNEGFANKLTQYIETDTSLLPIEEYNASMFVYSLIDTICEIPGVNRVWMLENGEKVQFEGDIYIGNSLLKNPGMIVDG